MGERVYLDFTHELYINEVREVEGHGCNPDMNYNFDMAWYTRIAKDNNKMYGCSVPFHPPIISEDGQKEIEICSNSTMGLKAQKNYANNRDTLFSDEFIPCAVFDIALGLPFIDDEGNNINEAYMRLYVKTNIKVKSTVIYYDSTTLAAEIGGYVGMFLGISMVDIAIMVNSSMLSMLNKLSK